MARRKKTSTADDVVDLVAMLPWWVGVALALVLYLVLHRIAVRPVVVPTELGQMGESIVRSMWQALAMFGQYLLPFFCLNGSAVSAIERHKRKTLVVDVAQSQASDVLDRMSWQEFEMLVGEGFRLQGYKVVETGGGGPDGGIDLVLSRAGKNGNEKFLVQCKQWRAFKVGVDVVRELYGVMAARGATGGFVVTSGRFTDEAIQFADGRNVKLVDGPKLHGLIRQAKAGAQTAVRKGPEAAGRQAATAQSATPNCPTCAKPMTKRVAKRGGNAGQAFWGCTDYPSCRGTRTIQ